MRPRAVSSEQVDNPRRKSASADTGYRSLANTSDSLPAGSFPTHESSTLPASLAFYLTLSARGACGRSSHDAFTLRAARQFVGQV